MELIPPNYKLYVGIGVVMALYSQPVRLLMRDMAEELGKDPERCAKIAASKLGKKRPPHVIEAMRIGRTGKPQSAETRRKMSISQQANRGPNKQSTRVT